MLDKEKAERIIEIIEGYGIQKQHELRTSECGDIRSVIGCMKVSMDLLKEAKSILGLPLTEEN